MFDFTAMRSAEVPCNGWNVMPMTSSPTLTSVTAAPISSTVPAKSDPMTRGPESLARGPISPFLMR